MLAGKRVLKAVCWSALWASPCISFVIHADFALLIVWAVWLASAVSCIGISRGHRLRASLLVGLSGLLAFRLFAVLLVFVSCLTGGECGI